MSGDWAPLAWLVVTLIPLLLLTRWLSRHLQGAALLYSGDDQIALLLHYLILLPGILLHELSHALAAQLVGVKTRRVSLRPQTGRGGAVRFGAVTVAKSDPFRESWIGFAPLLSGTAVILLLARWHFGTELPLTVRPETLWPLLAPSLWTPDVLMRIYLIFAISNAMWPSESDRQPWGAVLVFLGLIAGVFYMSGLLPYLPLEFKRWIITGVTYLCLAFGLAAAVDIPFALLLFALERLGERLLRRHVEY